MNIINGKAYPNGSISIVGNKVFINGALVTEEGIDQKIVNIMITPNDETKSIEINGADTVRVYGKVGSLVTSSGDIEVMGDVHSAKSVSGNIKFETLIEGGSVKTTSGNIKFKQKK